MQGNIDGATTEIKNQNERMLRMQNEVGAEPSSGSGNGKKKKGGAGGGVQDLVRMDSQPLTDLPGRAKKAAVKAAVGL